jgi:hypothetical protein
VACVIAASLPTTSLNVQGRVYAKHRSEPGPGVPFISAYCAYTVHTRCTLSLSRRGLQFPAEPEPADGNDHSPTTHGRPTGRARALAKEPLRTPHENQRPKRMRCSRVRRVVPPSAALSLAWPPPLTGEHRRQYFYQLLRPGTKTKRRRGFCFLLPVPAPSCLLSAIFNNLNKSTQNTGTNPPSFYTGNPQWESI